ncbi:LacI family DNA-binding transcriptional regulator [Paenibacillus sp.]|uniref:LacI family DNA-binding transcriptional regulator n=1 Tax=Paenibacillus sp. TaxID=58172 RepID=UPI002D4EF001|nr:LacI family DNA-binding transcriptional regulator [Paenibacillus sp.]HZG58809.1 LacI family DNA-binding transcriptional regulator [Paenibacillus sp.]
MRKRVKLDDIAKVVGLSKMAVSLALREDISVSKDTIQRVKQVADQLGYTPNRFAQGLVNGRSRTLAMLLGGSLHDDYQNQIIRGAIPYAVEKGYTLSIAPAECEPKLEASYIDKYQNMMVDGFLAFHCRVSEPYKKLKKSGFPFVLYTKYFEDLDCDYVVCNDFSGGYRITRHLLELGHRNIAFVYDDYLTDSSEVVNRKRGYMEALQEYGIAPELSLQTPFVFDFRVDQADTNYHMAKNQRFRDLMLSRNRPTALFVCNDVLASSVYSVIKKLGLTIPGDVSVVGYEGVYLGQILDPPLTTVKSPIQEIGRRACQLLIDKIEGEVASNETVQIKLEPVLEIRGSTAKL